MAVLLILRWPPDRPAVNLPGGWGLEGWVWLEVRRLKVKVGASVRGEVRVRVGSPAMVPPIFTFGLYDTFFMPPPPTSVFSE